MGPYEIKPSLPKSEGNYYNYEEFHDGCKLIPLWGTLRITLLWGSRCSMAFNDYVEGHKVDYIKKQWFVGLGCGKWALILSLKHDIRSVYTRLITSCCPLKASFFLFLHNFNVDFQYVLNLFVTSNISRNSHATSISML